MWDIQVIEKFKDKIGKLRGKWKPHGAVNANAAWVPDLLDNLFGMFSGVKATSRITGDEVVMLRNYTAHRKML